MTIPSFVFSEDEFATVKKITDMALEIIQDKLDNGGVFHLALTGGRTGNLLSCALADKFNDAPERFLGLHIWWGDERFVSNESEDRNDFALRTNLDSTTRIHLHPVLPPEEVQDVETSAKRYNADLHGIEFDLIILGVGPDGHVGSLFPDIWDEDEKRSAIAVVDSPKPPAHRVSLSIGKINSSQRVWLIAGGENKRDVVARMRVKDVDLPVNHVRALCETLVFVDGSSSPKKG
jgi:6-phosphogluconolactonase